MDAIQRYLSHYDRRYLHYYKGMMQPVAEANRKQFCNFLIEHLKSEASAITSDRAAKIGLIKLHLKCLSSPVSVLVAGHRDTVTSLTMSPCTDLFISGSMDGTIRFWDLRGPACQGIVFFFS